MLMTEEKLDRLSKIITAPYMALATMAICKPRRAAGNQYRHMAQTLNILIDYGHIDSVLHKAALVHDLIEDLYNFDQQLINNADEDGPEVLKLVLEVTKNSYEQKADFLERIYREGSENARLLKSADRIANLIDIGLMTDLNFISRYCDESEIYVLPISDQVDKDMSTEIKDLIASRRKLLYAFEHQFWGN